MFWDGFLGTIGVPVDMDCVSFLQNPWQPSVPMFFWTRTFRFKIHDVTLWNNFLQNRENFFQSTLKIEAIPQTYSELIGQIRKNDTKLYS